MNSWYGQIVHQSVVEDLICFLRSQLVMKRNYFLFLPPRGLGHRNPPSIHARERITYTYEENELAIDRTLEIEVKNRNIYVNNHSKRH